MEARIELILDRTVTGLAGYELGKKVFDEQVKDKIDYDSPITIVFPDNIKKLASSFIQGFFGEIIENIGIVGIEKQVTIVAENDKLPKSIIENLL